MKAVPAALGRGQSAGETLSVTRSTEHQETDLVNRSDTSTLPAEVSNLQEPTTLPVSADTSRQPKQLSQDKDPRNTQWNKQVARADREQAREHLAGRIRRFFKPRKKLKD